MSGNLWWSASKAIKPILLLREREKKKRIHQKKKTKKQSIYSKIEQYTILGLLKDFGDFQESYRIVRER